MWRVFLTAGVLALLTAIGLSSLTLRWMNHENTTEMIALSERSAVALDLQFSNWKVALSGLANSHSMLRDFDLGNLRWEAERVAKEIGGWAVLLPADDLTLQLFNTVRVGPEPLRPSGPVPELAVAVERSRVSGKPELSDIFFGGLVQRPVVAVVQYATASTGKDYVVALAFDAMDMSKTLQTATLSDGDFISVSDGSNRVVARSSGIEEFFLRPLPAWFVTATQGASSAETLVVRGSGVVGTEAPSYIFARRVLAAAPGWGVSVAKPVSSVSRLSYVMLAPLLGSVLVLMVVMTIGLMRHAVQRREADLQAATAQSERERTLRADLEQALAELRAAEAARTDMLGVLGHEMRTPVLSALAAIQMFPKSLQDQDERGYLNLAEKGLKVLQSLIEDILDLARIKAGEFRLDDATVCLPTLLGEVADIMKPAAERHKLAFRCDWPKDAIPVTGDSARIRQVLINLLSNAFKYTRKGSVTLSASWQAEGDGTCHIEICVVDTGEGISEEKLGDVFKPFVRLDRARNSRISGLGLGLPISERLATAMGGRIDVTSRLGQGSRFCLMLDLPIAPIKVEEAAAPVPDTSPFAGLNVLVVEDHPLQAALVTAVLEAMQARTVIATMGQEALDAVKRDSFDVILIDLGLPDMSGVDVIRELKDLGSNAVHIALSANPASLRDEERELFDAVATKTASKSELSNLLRSALHRHQHGGVAE